MSTSSLKNFYSYCIIPPEFISSFIVGGILNSEGVFFARNLSEISPLSLVTIARTSLSKEEMSIFKEILERENRPFLEEKSCQQLKEAKLLLDIINLNPNDKATYYTTSSKDMYYEKPPIKYYSFCNGVNHLIKGIRASIRRQKFQFI